MGDAEEKGTVRLLFFVLTSGLMVLRLLVFYSL